MLVSLKFRVSGPNESRLPEITPGINPRLFGILATEVGDVSSGILAPWAKIHPTIPWAGYDVTKAFALSISNPFLSPWTGSRPLIISEFKPTGKLSNRTTHWVLKGIAPTQDDIDWIK